MLHQSLGEAYQTISHLQISSAGDPCITHPCPQVVTGKLNPRFLVAHMLRGHGNAMHDSTPAEYCYTSACKHRFAKHARHPVERSVTCRSPGKAEIRLTLLSRPEVSSWIDRELQALLLDGDVSVVSQHILGSLRVAFPASAKRCEAPWLYSFAICTALGCRICVQVCPAVACLGRHGESFCWQLYYDCCAVRCSLPVSFNGPTFSSC